jgi:hypothetical protein
MGAISAVANQCCSGRGKRRHTPFHHHRLACASAILLVGSWASGCGQSEGARWRAEEEAVQNQYKDNYRRWLAKDDDEIIKTLLSLRAPYLSPRRPSESLIAEHPPVSPSDPTPLLLLRYPETMESLDLERPRRFIPDIDLRKLIGPWRCWPEDGSLHTVGAPGPHPVVPCDAIARGFVLREGGPAGDWLIMLPIAPGCPWLYIGDDGRCFESLKAWLAASVVGAQSRWDSLGLNEDALVREMRTQPERSLTDSVAELRADQPNDLMNWLPDLAGADFAEAAGDYSAVLSELGDRRPPVILAAGQTYRPHWGYSQLSALVRVWTGNGFSSMRLRPQDFDNAVAVVAQGRMPPTVIQLSAGQIALYLDVRSRRAFRTFKDWVDYGRAQERIWGRSGFRLPHNVAPMPFG